MPNIKQETLLDHSPSNQELYDISFCKNRKEYHLLTKNWESNLHYADIYKLYVFRDDTTTAETYLEKIDNKETKITTKQGYPTQALIRKHFQEIN